MCGGVNNVYKGAIHGCRGVSAVDPVTDLEKTQSLPHPPDNLYMVKTSVMDCRKSTLRGIKAPIALRTVARLSPV